MKSLFLLLSVIITSLSVSNTADKKESISILYHNGVKDKMIIVGEYTGNIELTGYHNTLTTKFKEALKRFYKDITVAERLPETGKVLVVRSIEPKLTMKEGKTRCTIFYNCEVWNNKKRENSFSNTVFNDYPGEQLDGEKTMALISYTHQDMINKIAHELR